MKNYTMVDDVIGKAGWKTFGAGEKADFASRIGLSKNYVYTLWERIPKADRIKIARYFINQNKQNPTN